MRAVEELGLCGFERLAGGGLEVGAERVEVGAVRFLARGGLGAAERGEFVREPAALNVDRVDLEREARDLVACGGDFRLVGARLRAGGGELLHRLVALALDGVAGLADEIGIGGAALRDGEVGVERTRLARRQEPAERHAGGEREQRDEGEFSHAASPEVLPKVASYTVQS